ncbi:FAD:protein FMN transferase ApbE [Erwinia sp. HR93]|uniref:FAD:protein FMN transferase ApbE n=1 Tax=Erwinia sp. HR93 TaxID=3094840 RepID=UPI002ADEB133|nr:FAD:protein FMN transferase ApbE [Erwinia sp. HR93]MEA1065520.1 FAD:protein FMN transferase ApbE [Erwinia sp. HR93]
MLKRHAWIIGYFIVSLSACDSDNRSLPSAIALEGKTMGTSWHVSIASGTPVHLNTLRQIIQQTLDNEDRQLSTWKPDSMLSRFNRQQSSAPWPVSEAISDIVIRSLRIGAKTEGAMDITVGPLVNLWGFGPDKQPLKTPTPAQIAAARAKTGLQHLRVINDSRGQWLQKDVPELYLDLSTVGEGYAADSVAHLLEQEGFQNYLVSVGGAVTSRGVRADGKPWRVAIQKPTDQENAAQAVVTLNGQGISTSGSYRNYYELDGQRLSHVIDPRTGAPIRHKLVSATVIARDALEADAWDTGLMVLGPEEARALALKENLAVYLIIKEAHGFSVWASPGFKPFLLNKTN